MSMPTTINGINAAQRILEAVVSEAEVAKAIQANDLTPRMKRIFSQDGFAAQNIVRTQMITHQWRKIGRQVLSMHPEVVEEVRVANSDKVPGEVLRVMPYINPMVVYPIPPVFESWPRQASASVISFKAESQVRLLGFICYGTSTVGVDEPGMIKDKIMPTTRVEQRIYPTTDLTAERFGVLLVLESMDAMGNILDTEFNNITMFFRETLTLAEMVDGIMSRYHWASGTPNDELEAKRRKKWMRALMSTVVGTLFYLCSTTLEADPVPAKFVAKKLRGKSIERKPFSLYNVGWTTGAALTRYRQQRVRYPSEQADVTHQQDPQHRCGHFKMQPYGPGKTRRKLIYVSPYWTHIERLGEQGVNTARRVPREGGGGAARDSLDTALNMAALPVDLESQ